MGFWSTVLYPHQVRAELRHKGMLMAEDWIRGKRADRASGLLGTPVTTQGEMRSAERFTPQGQPIYDRATLQQPRTEYVGGFLGGRQGPGEMAQLRQNYIDAGYNVPETRAMTNPIIEEQMKRAIGMGRFKDMNTYASQLTSLSSDAQKALAPFDQAMLGYKQISNLYRQNTSEGGAIKDLEGPFDLALQRNFIKALSVLRPEAYMQDDAVQAMMAAQNIGDFAQLKNWLTGDIKLNEKGRKRMLKAYDSIMKDNYEVMQMRRDPYERQAELLFPDTPQETIFGASPAEYEPGLFTGGSMSPEEALSAPGEVRTTKGGMRYKVLNE